MTEERPRDLGTSCGNPEGALRWAPQEVIELHVPGSGLVAVEIDTAVEGTMTNFNTVVQVRRECGRVPEGVFPATCLDDVNLIETRARGAVQAMGGETLYLLVTGYSNPPSDSGQVDRGMIKVDVRVRQNTAPTLTSGFVRLALNDVRIGATGTDADADVVGVAMTFLDAEGEIIDSSGDGEGTLDGDVIQVAFAPRQTMTAYDGRARVDGDQVTLAAYLRSVRAARAVLRAFDAGGAPSESIEVPVEDLPQVGYGEACDDTNVCRNPMTCGAGGQCEVTGAAARVCTDATVVEIETPTTTATTATITMSSTGAQVGYYEQSCAPEQGWIGRERAYSITVGEGGNVDLLATTDLPGTGSTDTIMSLRRECPDIGTEIQCNDDISPSNPQSAVEGRDLAPGTYWIMVERFGGLASGTIRHDLQVTLRPVLAAGATCDPAGVQNRCATGACIADTMLCPPAATE